LNSKFEVTENIFIASVEKAAWFTESCAVVSQKSGSTVRLKINGPEVRDLLARSPRKTRVAALLNCSVPN
jgi:sarcosine oxidase gamma subunit